MEDKVTKDWDSAFDKLEAQRAAKLAKAAEKTEKPKPETQESEEDNIYFASVELEKASELLKKTAILLEFLGDADLCKSITRREREIIAKHVDRINELTDELDEAVEAFEEDDEEDMLAADL